MKILKADGSAGWAYITKTFVVGAAIGFQFDVYVPTATFTALTGGSAPASANLEESGVDGFYLTPPYAGTSGYSTDNTPHGPFAGFTPDVWHTVQHFRDAGGNVTWKLDGVTFDTYTVTPSTGSRNFDFGARYSNSLAGEIYYIDNIRIGTTAGGSDILSEDFESGSLTGWTVVGACSIITDPFTPPPEPAGLGGVRVLVAFDDPTLAPDPAWTSLTQYESLVASYEITRGRQYEFDKTDTGTARVTINDQDGLLDPTNTTGPYFSKIEPLLQIRLDLWNPVAETWSTRFRGFIEDYDYAVGSFARQDADGNTVGNTRLEISCVDLFAVLTAIEMQADGTFGDPPPTTPVDVTGNIFFDNATGHDRIDQVLGNASIDPAFYVVFTLNINCQESIYSPSQNVLEVVQEVADAEFPTVSNVYCDRLGRLAVHGRLAKFDPAGVAAGASPGAWDFHSWKAGDGYAVGLSPSDTAHIRSFAFNRGWSKLFNYAFCTPKDIASADIAAQVSTDPASITQYGFRSWSAENLILGALTGDPLTGVADTLTGLDAKAACKTFADYIVANYASPRNRITDVSFRSMRPDATGAAANWDLLTKVDISDVVAVSIRGPGDAAGEYIFNAEEFFVEGIRETVTPLNPDYANVTTTLDLSPKAYFTTGAWTGD